MKTSGFFLGTRRVQPVDDDDDDDAAAGSLSWELARASSLVINDEPHSAFLSHFTVFLFLSIGLVIFFRPLAAFRVFQAEIVRLGVF